MAILALQKNPVNVVVPKCTSEFGKYRKNIKLDNDVYCK